MANRSCQCSSRSMKGLVLGRMEDPKGSLPMDRSSSSPLPLPASCAYNEDKIEFC